MAIKISELNELLGADAANDDFLAIVDVSANETKRIDILQLTTNIENSNFFYKKDNILGTVTQSGGVPTGAVIERGSNANGEFVKFADGTMICNLEGPERSVPTATGPIFQQASDNTWTVPAAFSESPFCCGQVENQLRWVCFARPTTTDVAYRQLASVSSATALKTRLTVIGRWF